MKRVLIADDAFELGRLLQTVFLTIDPTLSVQVVPSAEEALLESSRKPIDLLVSDIRLPGMSGLDLVKKIRVRHAGLKVIIITGMTDVKVVESVRDLNVDAFFHKPVEMSAFLAAARKLLDLPSETPPALTRPGVAAGPKPAPEPPAARSAGTDRPSQRLAPAPAAPPQESLSAMVTGLRQRLSALAVWVLDERGRIVVQAGDVPDLPLEDQWAELVLAALSAGAKVARLAGEGGTPQVLAFQGKEFHIVLAPAGDYAVLVVMHPGRSVLRMALAVEEALENQQALAEVLTAMRPTHTPAQELAAAVAQRVQGQTSPLVLPAQPRLEPVAASAPEPPMHDFEALFQQKAQAVPDQDVNAFWDALSAGEQPGMAVDPDVLTYDQARQLGLTPHDEAAGS